MQMNLNIEIRTYEIHFQFCSKEQLTKDKEMTKASTVVENKPARLIQDEKAQVGKVFSG